MSTLQSAVVEPVLVKPDSSEVYRNIETFSKKNKFSKFIYGLVFKPVKPAVVKKKQHHELLHHSYDNLEGKIIRNINIISLDPFGYSVRDTFAIPQNSAYNIGNNLHVKTQHFTIKNTILFHKNRPFDLLVFKESERLVRRQPYLHDVVFTVMSLEQSKDSVDIVVRVQDKWSFVPSIDLSPIRFTMGFTENNFAGLGHEFHNAYTLNHAKGKNAFISDYGISNIRNSYSTIAMHYNREETGSSNKSLTVDRPFYSPLARWAGGLSFSRQFQKDTVTDTSPDLVRQDLKWNTEDYWAGKAFRISPGNTEDARTTNVIITGRYLHVGYREKPDELHDPLHRYAKEEFYLSGIGISTRNYVQDNYIFNFGVIEDVPIGKVYGITSGYQIRNTTARLYLGTRVSFGSYQAFGYLSPYIEYGTFLHGRFKEQGVFAAGAHYIGNLYEIGNWRIRQFVKPQITLGMDRFAYDSLTINNENGIRGFSSSLHGTKKAVLTLQTQSYAPWNVVGFRMGPYLICSLGKIGDASSGFRKSPLYSQFGIGALLKNDFLVFSNFQFSIAYYPVIPGKGFDRFKINSFVTADFGFRDFNLGKPEIVPFQ